MRTEQDNQNSKSSSVEILKLWKAYKETGDINLRNQLVVTFTPLVKYIVYKKVRELPARCEVEDFVSCGLEALITSIERYDPTRGATLEQYSWTRIRGAVLDELRRQDWAPRSLRRWERSINSERQKFTANNGRPPTETELAEILGIGVKRLEGYENSIGRSDIVSLNAVVASDDETTVERIDTIACDDIGSDPEHVTAVHEAKDKFRAAFGKLSQREQKVAVMLYAQNLTLREIGETLNVSESRVCQIHSQLKSTLRSQLAEDTPLFAAIA